MGMFEPVGRFIRSQVVDIVFSPRAHTRWNPVKACGRAHSIGNRVISTGAVAANAQPTNDFTPRVKSHSAAECDNAARYPANARPLWQEIGIE